MRSVCFTGHRTFIENETIKRRLVSLLEKMIQGGITSRRSGTGQTVRMSDKKGITVINLFCCLE